MPTAGPMDGPIPSIKSLRKNPSALQETVSLEVTEFSAVERDFFKGKH
jgi:hypothetical protein